MDRRIALQKIALLTGSMVGLPSLATALDKWDAQKSPLLDPNYELLSEIADIIIPTTDTPGAKAANVAQFITIFVEDCYKTDDKTAFYKGLTDFQVACAAAYKKSFMDLSQAERVAYLTKLDKAANPFFKTMKRLTAAGYFTSEIGMSQALAYNPIPKSWKGCVPLEKGQKAWAG
jgi:Gluconate 2-dehydrogenase subunit 3